VPITSPVAGLCELNTGLRLVAMVGSVLVRRYNL